jgi:tripartite ATP-independent transporter DctP family solute receptor
MAKDVGLISRRTVVKAAAGLATLISGAATPFRAVRAASAKLILAHNSAPPEITALSLQWYAKELTSRSNGALDVEFQGGTLLTKEIDVVNAVRSGSVAIGSPIGAVATLFPEMGVFLVPYLVSSYAQAYGMFNGQVGEQFDKSFQEKYGIKVLFYFDLGFRHIWNNRHAITDPKSLRGLKIRSQPSKIFADTINGLGGVAVPLAWSETITGAQQGVIDGADLPVANMIPLRAYEVSKYYSLTYHNYGPTFLAMNLKSWNALDPQQQKLFIDVGREAQARMRSTIEDVDNLEAAKKLLEPKGMTLNAPDLEPFKELARKNVWPAYQAQYKDLWEQIASTAK